MANFHQNSSPGKTSLPIYLTITVITVANPYMMIPHKNASENPKLIATKTAKADPNTEAAPLIPHAQGTAAGFFEPKYVIPAGNGIPIAIPKQAVKATDAITRIPMEKENKYSMSTGRNTI